MVRCIHFFCRCTDSGPSPCEAKEFLQAWSPTEVVNKMWISQQVLVHCLPCHVDVSEPWKNWKHILNFTTVRCVATMWYGSHPLCSDLGDLGRLLSTWPGHRGPWGHLWSLEGKSGRHLTGLKSVVTCSCGTGSEAAVFLEQNPTAMKGWFNPWDVHMRCTLPPIFMEVENGALEDEFSLRKGYFLFPWLLGKTYHTHIIQLVHSVVYEAKLIWDLLNVFSLPGNAYKACKNQLVLLMTEVCFVAQFVIWNDLWYYPIINNSSLASCQLAASSLQTD